MVEEAKEGRWETLRERQGTRGGGCTHWSLPECWLPTQPAAEGGGGLLSGLASALGGNAAMLANITSGFSKLGMSADLAKKFVPIVLAYLRQHAGAELVAKVEAALRA